MFGLTTNEARIYLVLMRGSSFTASQLSDLTGVHRSRVYDNLKGLEGKGLITLLDDEPRRYRALPIQKGVDHLICMLESDFVRRKKEIMDLGLTLERMFHSDSPPMNSAYTILPHQILDELLNHLKSATERVWVCKKTAGGVLDWFSLKNELVRLSSLGVDIRLLGNTPIEIGFPVRYCPELTVSFAVIDSLVMCFLLEHDSDKHGTAVVSRHKEYVEFLSDTFVNWWGRATR